jgi:hypothetical protein
MKTRKLLLLGCVLAFAVSEAQTTKRELWMWKDANGVTHYSDVPAPGAKRVVVAGGSPVTAAAPPAPQSTSSASSSRSSEGPDRPPPAVQYVTLEIVSPTEGATYFQADAAVEVSVSSQPALASGDRLMFYLDGSALEGADGSYQRTLTGLARGTHTVSAAILNAQGQRKISSAPRSFNIRIDTVSNPRNVGPALRPRPPTPPPTPPPPPKSPK